MIGTVLLILIAIWLVLGVMISMSSEKVNYVVIEKLGDGVEIRHYAENTIISTDADDSNSAFRKKADIFLMRYDPPWIPPIIMRNELSVEIE